MKKSEAADSFGWRYITERQSWFVGDAPYPCAQVTQMPDGKWTGHVYRIPNSMGYRSHVSDDKAEVVEWAENMVREATR